MTRCEVYEFLSFLAGLDRDEDFLVPAIRVNKLDELLRTNGIRCDFTKQSFELAAYEYPEIIEVCDESITIKAHRGNRRRFVYLNSNKEVALKIQESWEVVIREY